MSVRLTETDKIKVLNSDDLYGIMQRILMRENKIDRDREHFWVIGLATTHRLLFIELVSKGTIDKTLVEPMEVFSFALQKRAAKIMLVHNHPGGELKPSDADKDITDRLIQVGIIVDTNVLDHLIISEKSYLSFNDIGLLDILKESKKYVPAYVQIEQIREEEARIRKEVIKDADKRVKAAKEKEKITIAKEMKQEGLPNKIIQRFVGLTIEEIEGIKISPKK